MKWIYLSPHFDDVVLSCGGIIWEQTYNNENVEIWTVCSAEPGDDNLSEFASDLHQRWSLDNRFTSSRKEEDQQACKILNCEYQYLNIPDVIYRQKPDGRPIINEEKDLFSPISLDESNLLISLTKQIAKMLPEHCYLISPIGVGGHVDHRITRCAADSQSIPIMYYVEYPYCREKEFNIQQWRKTNWSKKTFSISDLGLIKWKEAIKAYKSQISTFWNNELEMEKEVDKLWSSNNNLGILWQARS